MRRQVISQQQRNDVSNESSIVNHQTRMQSSQSESCVSSVEVPTGISQDFTTIPVKLRLSSVRIQPKLRIGDANDKYEQEADRVADQVMRMPEPRLSHPNSALNKTSVNSSQRKCTPCIDEDEFVQRKPTATNSLEIGPAISSQINGLSGRGRPMSAIEKGFFEPRFGNDFSNVRIHDNTHANQLAHSISARAFTIDNHIVFGRDQSRPEEKSGRHLLAHELTHVVQQNQNLAKQPILRRQQTPTTATPSFSVNRQQYLQKVQSAVANIGGRLVDAYTLSRIVQPILRAMLAQVTFREDSGVNHGGGTIQHLLNGAPPVVLSLQLVLDDTATATEPAGSFNHTNSTNGVINIRIRKNPTADDITETIYHEAIHLLSWIIDGQGSSRLVGGNQRVIRTLDMTRFRSRIASIRNQLDLLVTNISPRRQASGQSAITPAQLDNMAEWLMEEVQVRAQTEVFRLASSVQRQRRSRGAMVFMLPGPKGDISARMVDRYVFDFSRVFLPSDRASLNQADKRILVSLLNIMDGFFRLQVRSQFSLSALTIGRRIPRASVRRLPPAPLTRPPLRPLPLP